MAAEITPPKCQDVIDACNLALDARDEQIKLGDLALKEKGDQYDATRKELTADEAWYNSKVLWAAIGASAVLLLKK